MPPPRLKASSTERMQAVVETADALVDAGESPNDAIAKSAADHGLPVGHVALVVRAFNTGRAVRQLGEKDVWDKAASYPVASVEGVLDVMGATGKTEKKADCSDYALPPDFKQTDQKTILIKSAAPVIVTPQELPKNVTDKRLSQSFKAAAVVDALRERAAALTPAQYAAVKQAAARLEPEAAAYAFPRIETLDRGIAKKAAANAKPDPLTRTDDPAIELIKELGEIKRAYVAKKLPDKPYGYEKIAGDREEVWYRKLPTCSITGMAIEPIDVVLPPTEKPAAAPLFEREPLHHVKKADDDDPVEKPKAPALGRAFSNLYSKYTATPDAPKEKSYPGAMARGMAYTGLGIPSALMSNKFTRGALDFNPKDSPLMRGLGWGKEDVKPSVSDSDLKSVTDDLNADLNRIDQHAAIQDILADRRFAKSDPSLVIKTYKQLQSLAPRAMNNPAVASDFINRTLQTGPMSYYDLKALTDIERNISMSAPQRQPDSDKDD